MRAVSTYNQFSCRVTSKELILISETGPPPSSRTDTSCTEEEKVELSGADTRTVAVLELQARAQMLLGRSPSFTLVREEREAYREQGVMGVR